MLLDMNVFQVMEITGCMNSDLSHLELLVFLHWYHQYKGSINQLFLLLLLATCLLYLVKHVSASWIERHCQY
jgi:hypothetical protein